MRHQKKIIRKFLAKIFNSSDFLFEIAMLIYQNFETSLSIYFYFFDAKTQDFYFWVAAVFSPAQKL